MNILAIDLGSSFIKTAIVKFDGDGIKLLSIFKTPTYGIKSGKITSIEDASNSIRRAVKGVKESISVNNDKTVVSKSLSVNIDKIVVSISGAYTNSLKGFSELTLDTDGATITRKDIERAIENSKISAGIPKEQIPIHVLPYKFKANNTDNIEDPLDMRASSFRLEANIITMNKNDYENIKQILSIADINKYDLVSSIYANSLYCLNSDEKENGVAIIDCGAQVCDIAIYSYNSLIWMNHFPFGSAHITNDIAKFLTITNEAADKIKLQFYAFKNGENNAVDYYKTGSTTKDTVSVDTIAKCVNSRVDEMLECIYASISDSQYERYVSSVVLTGGCAKFGDISEKAFPKFNNKAVRTLINKNKFFIGESEYYTQPEYTCLFGLCMYASGFHTKYELNSNGILLVKQKKKDFDIIDNYQSIENTIKKADLNNEDNIEIDIKLNDIEENNKNVKKEIKIEGIKIEKNKIKEKNFFQKAWEYICETLERRF